MSRFSKPLQVPKIVVGLDIIPNIGHAGVSYINGPLVVGSPIVPTAAFAINLPTVPSVGAYSVQQNSIGLQINSPTTGFIINAPASILNGVLTTNGIKVTNGTKTTNGLDTKNGLSVKNDVAIGNGQKIENAGNIINGAVVMNGDVTVNGSFKCASVAVTGVINTQAWKKFDIKHPNKEGWRLSHVCPEAPDPEVYIRGTTTSNKIELPDYWKGLVDFETISVHLTPIGNWQALYFEKVEWEKYAIIKNSDGGAVNCSYQIWAKTHDWKEHQTEYQPDEDVETVDTTVTVTGT